MNKEQSDALAVQVASLRKLYGDVVAVDDVSFEVERGSIFCVAFGLAGDRKFEFPGEPAIGLDPESRFRFQSRSCLRRQNARGMTIVTTTHYLEEAREYCDADVARSHAPFRGPPLLGLAVYGKTALPSSRYAEPPTVVTVTSCR